MCTLFCVSSAKGSDRCTWGHIVSSTTNLRPFRDIVLRTLNNSHCSNLIPNWHNYES